MCHQGIKGCRFPTYTPGDPDSVGLGYAQEFMFITNNPSVSGQLSGSKTAE